MISIYENLPVFAQGKKYHPPLHLGVVAIEKGAFGSHSTTVVNLTDFYLFLHIS